MKQRKKPLKPDDTTTRIMKIPAELKMFNFKGFYVFL